MSLYDKLGAVLEESKSTGNRHVIAKIHNSIRHLLNELQSSKPGRMVHDTVMVPHPSGRSFKIDREIAPMLEVMWRLGIETNDSCQDFPFGYFYVHFSDCQNATKFMTAVLTGLDNVSQKDLDRLTQNNFSPGRWIYQCGPEGPGCRSLRPETRDTVGMGIIISIPHSDYEMVMNALISQTVV